MRSSHILYCLLSCSEPALKRFHICFTQEEMKGQRGEAPAQGHSTAAAEMSSKPISSRPTPTKGSALPIHCPPPFNPHWPLAPCKRRGSKINLQCPLGHTGSSQAWLCPAVAMPDPELTPLQSRDSRCLSHGTTHPGPSPAVTLLRRSPPPWCSGVLVSDALLVFSLLLLGSLSLIMSYWRQKRTMTPGGQGRAVRVLARLPPCPEPLLSSC